MREDRSEIVGGGKPPALEHMTEAEAVRFGAALCDALQKKQPPRGWHGALYPANLSYTTDGRVLLGPPLEMISSFSPDEVEYLAPELFWNGTGGPATDVYAVGLLLYAACNGGRPPFTGESGPLDAETRAAAASSRMKDEPLRAPKGAGDELSQIILRAVAYREEERWPDVESLRAALEDCSVYAAHPEAPADGADGLPAAPPPRAVEPGMKNADVVVPVPAVPQPPKHAEKPKTEKRAEKKTARQPEPEPPAAKPETAEPEKAPEPKRSPARAVSPEDIVRGAERAAEAAAGESVRAVEKPKAARRRQDDEPVPESYPRPVYDVFNEGKKKRRSPIPAILTILALAVIFLVILYFHHEKDKAPELTPTPSPTETATSISAEPTPTPTPWRPMDQSPSPVPEPSPDPDESPEPSPAPFAATRLQVGSASREEAAALCAKEGGHLPVINSQEDFDTLTAEADRQGLVYVWLDAKRGADGVWRTSDGAEVTFFKWLPNEPSAKDTDGTAENCLMLWKYRGVWGYNTIRNDPGSAYVKYYGGKIAVYCQKDE